MKLDEIILSILEGMEKHMESNYADGVTFPDEIKELIHKAAGECRKTGLYERASKNAPEEFKTGKASDLYLEMLVKVANAPTFLHAAGTLRLMLPLISDAIKREEQDGAAESV